MLRSLRGGIAAVEGWDATMVVWLGAAPLQWLRQHRSKAALLYLWCTMEGGTGDAEGSHAIEEMAVAVAVVVALF